MSEFEKSNRSIAVQAQRGLELRTKKDYWSVAQYIAKSDLSPKGMKSPENVFVAIQMGAEVGMSAMQSVQNIAVINGKPSLYGDALKALCLSSPVCDYINERMEGEGENRVAICESKRVGNGQPLVTRFSVADAKRAKLWGKVGKNGQPTPWVLYPDRMLMFRARGFNLRDNFSDLLCGMISREEAQDYPVDVSASVQVMDEAPRQAEPVPAELTDEEKELILLSERHQALGKRWLDMVKIYGFEVAYLEKLIVKEGITKFGAADGVEAKAKSLDDAESILDEIEASHTVDPEPEATDHEGEQQ